MFVTYFNRFFLIFSFCLFLWSTYAKAECTDPNWEKLRERLNIWSKTTYSCSAIKQVHKIIPFVINEDGSWFFLEEVQYRKSLQKSYKINLPQDIRIYGKVITDNQLVVIGGFQGYGVEWPMIALIQEIDEGDFFIKQDVPDKIGEGAEFGNVGIFNKGSDGRYDPDGIWISVENQGSPIYWENEIALPNLAKQCFRCEGWLCRKKYIMCISDFNQDARIEYIFNLFSAPGGNSSVVWGYNEQDQLVVIHDYLSSGGNWRKFEKEWIFVEKMWCRKYFPCDDLGDAGCYRPRVYRYIPQKFKFVPDNQLQNSLFPVKTITAPDGCKIEIPKGKLFYNNDGRWLLVKPHDSL